MAAKYTLASGKATPLLRYVVKAITQLSDGSLVYVRTDGASSPGYVLCRTSDRATETVLGNLIAVGTLSAGSISIARDASDNIAVLHPYSGAANYLWGEIWTKGGTASAPTWSSGNTIYQSAFPSNSYQVAETRVTWASTGSQGQWVVGATNTAGGYFFAAFDATSGALAGSSFLGSNSGGGDTGRFDLAQPAFGSATLLGALCSTSGATYVQLMKAATGTALAGIAGTSLSGVSARTATATRLLPLGSSRIMAVAEGTAAGAWSAQVLTVDAATPTLSVAAAAVQSGTITSLPANANTDTLWDAYVDPKTSGRVWLLTPGTVASGAVPIWSAAVTLTGSTLTWSTAAAQADSITVAAGTATTQANLTLRAARTALGSRADYQLAYNDTATPTYAAAGDYVLYDTAPYVPTLTLSGTVSGGTTYFDATQPLVATWPFSDPDAGDGQSKFDVRYRVQGASSWTTPAALTGVASTVSSASIPANTFSIGQVAEVQVQDYDQAGLASGWSTSAFATAAQTPSAPPITSPAAGSTLTTASATITWSTAQQAAYQVRKVADDGSGNAVPATVYYDSGAQTDSVARALALSFPTNQRVEHLQVRVQYQGLWSAWTDCKVTVNYTPPPTPSFTITPVATIDPRYGTDALDVKITNPTPGSGVPAASYCDVLVDDGNTEGLRRVATAVAPGSTWRHCTPVPGRDYTGGRIVVIAVAASGATATTSS